MTAYDIQYFQILSKTPLDRDLFDVVAKVPPGASKEQFRVMLQDLLAERFRLKTHRVRREFPSYALKIAKGGPKVSDGGSAPNLDGFSDWPPGKPGIQTVHTTQGGHVQVRVRAQSIAIAKLTGALHVPGDAPIVDETGLAGEYSFTLEYSYPQDDAHGPVETAPAPSVYSALQSQLGLRLVAKRVPFDVIVVDSFDRLPAEN